jgi:hypothetical protein
MSRRRPRVLLGITGSVAAVKTYELALRLAAFAEVHTHRRGLTALVCVVADVDDILLVGR